MAGIYLHIPFCKQACCYCNFHFSTSLKLKNDFLNALKQEIVLQKDYLKGETIETIYFGGGTPSLLESHEIQDIIEQLKQHHPIIAHPEITLEANPDDLIQTKLKELRQSPINRFSIGIQSFSEADLQYMNRAHNVEQAYNSIRWSQEMGFDNISIDLIYGTPTLSNEQWLKNMEISFNFDIPHISAYGLTVEPQTALDHFIKTGKRTPVDDEKSRQQMLLLMEASQKARYEHYEVSNFAQKGKRSQHNSSYWLGKKYLGLGPSAHSFNGTSRQWNIANNALYIKALKKQQINFELEELSIQDQYNEYIMVSLRTSWGVNLSKVQNEFGPSYLQHILSTVPKYETAQKLTIAHNTLKLTSLGILEADRISSDFFV